MGVAGALGALKRLSTKGGTLRSVLSGNLQGIGEIKVNSIAASELLDLEVAAFGDHHSVLADLVRVAVSAAQTKYGHEFEGTDIVLIGDTPLNVEAALAAGDGVLNALDHPW